MPSSSLFLRSSTTLLSALSLFSSAFATPQHQHIERQTSNKPYSLTKEYSGSSFFDQFYFFEYADPTHGYVTYGNRNYAQQNNLISYDGTYNYMKVDTTSVLKQTSGYYNVNNVGRKSVRIEGTYDFTHGLVITDVAHMPSGICGAWPAFWTLGRDTWPYQGEIDIIEGANAQSSNWMSLHTGFSSNLYGNSERMSGSISDYDCNVFTNGRDNPNYTGCKIVDGSSSTWANYQGGVWAMQWTSDAIKVWYWRYGQVPSDVTSAQPKPETWGTPRGSFAPSSSLNADYNFKNHHIIFDTTFCGDLGDATWESTGCRQRTGYSSCAAYVAARPNDFTQAYWQVKYVKIFQNDGTTTTTSSTTTTTSSTTKSTTTSTTTTTTTTSSKPTTTTTSSTTTPASSTKTTLSTATITTTGRSPLGLPPRPSSSTTTTTQSKSPLGLGLGIPLRARDHQEHLHRHLERAEHHRHLHARGHHGHAHGHDA